jgi:hypothetical protein
MTCNLVDVGSHNRRREPGYGLVIQRPDPLDVRQHETFLTSEGRELMHEVLRVMTAS